LFSKAYTLLPCLPNSYLRGVLGQSESSSILSEWETLGIEQMTLFALGKCDDIVRDLASKLGWEEELQRAWEATADSVETEKTQTTGAVKIPSNDESKNREKERLQTEVDKLTGDLEKSLALTDDSTDGKEETTDKSTSVQKSTIQKPSAAEPEGTQVPSSSKAQSDGKL